MLAQAGALQRPYSAACLVNGRPPGIQLLACPHGVTWRRRDLLGLFCPEHFLADVPTPVPEKYLKLPILRVRACAVWGWVRGAQCVFSVWVWVWVGVGGQLLG